ncbi:hypothetical protein LCGC14_2173850 [marine sediment metagenome]|uniref:Uncharacterized protein n=1 Tax=marine sediment metagenome TaxID=412755 RepID=A0A0F9GK28_9ZZZZ
MNPEEKQTVTEDQPAADAPNEGTEAQTEAPGAQDTADTDWDALLDDSKPESEKPTPEPEAKSGELKALQAKVDRMEAAFSKKDADEGITTAVGQIKAGKLRAIAVTSAPASTNASARWEPMNPSAPVTKTLVPCQFIPPFSASGPSE